MARFTSEVTLQKLVYNLGNLTRGGYQSDDEPLSDREKMFIINGCRATLMERELGKGRTLSKIFEQTIHELDLEMVPYISLDGYDSGTQILRTVDKIPKFIKDLGDADGIGLSYIGSRSGFEDYQRHSAMRVQFSKYAKYTGNLRKVIFNENYIYVINEKELESLTIRGYFADPIEAGKRNNPDFDWTYPYPFPESWVDALNKLAYQTDIAIMLKGQTDLINDSSSTLKPQEPAQQQDQQ